MAPVPGFFLSFWQNIKRGYNDENEKTGTRRPPINEATADPKPEAKTDREIIDRYKDTIRQLCRRYGRDGAEMETNLMAEVLKVYRHKATKEAQDTNKYVKTALYHKAYHLYMNGKRQRDFENEAAAFSLDAPGSQGRDGRTPLVECVPDDRQLDMAEALELKIRRQVVLHALRKSPRLQNIAELFLAGCSYTQIGKMYGFTCERARQAECQIIRTVRLELGIDFEGRPTGRKRRNVQRPL